MDQSLLTHTYRFHVDALNDQHRAEQIKSLLRACLENALGRQKVATDVEHRILTISSSELLDIVHIKTSLQPHGFHLREAQEQAIVASQNNSQSTNESKVINVYIDGMTCHSCEVTIERNWKKLEGIKKVEVNVTTGKAQIAYAGSAPTIPQLQNALGKEQYLVSENGGVIRKTKTPILQLVGIFALVLILGNIFSKLGWLKSNFAIGSEMSFGAVFIIGLVAASSSCIAIAGGLLLSSASKFNERYTFAGPMGRMRPVFLFVTGRIVGYTLLGGLLGVVGKVLAPSPLITALITILAALYMLVMGLDMLQIAPAWLKRLTPKMPKSVSHRVLDAEGKEHPLAPLALGAATFFLPCGFTQALQLYAITTGSFISGALTLMAFALGTAPALLALGWASGSLKGKVGKFFFKFSGALVVVLGLWNIQNGLTIAGYPLSFPTISFSAPTAAASASGTNIVMDGNTQVIKMAVDGGYQPSQFTLKAGLPTRWEIDGTKAVGCTSVLISRQLGIQKQLASGPNTVEFTAPTQPGTYPFSCSMGMYRGQITVVSNS